MEKTQKALNSGKVLLFVALKETYCDFIVWSEGGVYKSQDLLSYNSGKAEWFPVELLEQPKRLLWDKCSYDYTEL